MTGTHRENAIVRAVDCGPHEHYGIITAYVHLTDASGGWGQGFGGLCLKEEHAEDWKASIASLFGVDRYEDVVGRNCVVLRNWPDWGGDIEGLEVDGRRFVLTDFGRRHWPEKTVTPLEKRAARLRESIDRCAADIRRHVADLARVNDRYVEWAAPPTPTEKP